MYYGLSFVPCDWIVTWCVNLTNSLMFLSCMIGVHDIFGYCWLFFLQEIHQIQAKEFPVGQPDRHSLSKFLEPDLLFCNINDGT